MSLNDLCLIEDREIRPGLTAKIPAELSVRAHRALAPLLAEARARATEAGAAHDGVQGVATSAGIVAAVVEGWEGEHAPTEWPRLDSRQAFDLRLGILDAFPIRVVVEAAEACLGALKLTPGAEGNSAGPSASSPDGSRGGDGSTAAPAPTASRSA